MVRSKVYSSCRSHSSLRDSDVLNLVMVNYLHAMGFEESEDSHLRYPYGIHTGISDAGWLRNVASRAQDECRPKGYRVMTLLLFWNRCTGAGTGLQGSTQIQLSASPPLFSLTLLNKP